MNKIVIATGVVTVFATGLSGANGIAIDGNGLYVTDLGMGGLATDQDVLGITINGTGIEQYNSNNNISIYP
ncbi:MAG TPA: hypothetical protein VF411_02935, partial [Bacteroidia bacterium]